MALFISPDHDPFLGTGHVVEVQDLVIGDTSDAYGAPAWSVPSDKDERREVMLADQEFVSIISGSQQRAERITTPTYTGGWFMDWLLEMGCD